MPGDEALEKIHTLPFVPPVFDWSQHRIYIPNLEFLKPKFNSLSVVHIEIIPMKLRLGLSLTGWVTLHLRCTTTLYGVCLLTRITLIEYSLSLKITSNWLKMSIIAGICLEGYIPLSSNLKSIS